VIGTQVVQVSIQIEVQVHVKDLADEFDFLDGQALFA
jgi:hypothetical protein